MADNKDPFDDDLMAPPAEDEVVELEDSGLGVEELTEADETQSSGKSDETDFGDIDLDAPVEDLPTFEPPSSGARAVAPDPDPADADHIFESTDLDADALPAEQQSFGFEEPQPSAAELSAVGEDSLSQSPSPAPGGKNKKLLVVVVGVIGVAAIGGLALFMLSGSETPPPVAPVAYAPEPAAEPEPVAAAAPSEPVAAEAQVPAVAEPVAAAPAPAPAPVAKVEPKPAPKPEVKSEPKPEPKASAKPKPAAVSSGQAATRLLSVEVSTVGSADIVRFEFDGDAPTKIGSFALSDTPRYVVDFYGIESGPRVGAVSGRVVSGVRPGKHDGKYRVVLDMTTDGVTAKRRVDGNAVIVELR